MNNQLIKNRCLLLPILALVGFCACKSDQPQTTKIEDLHPVLVPRFEGDSAFQFVASQLDFGPRVPNSDAHRQCKDWLVSKLKSFSLEVLEQPFKAKTFHGEVITGYNILGQYKPEQSKRLLLAAHWDSRFRADSPLNKERTNEPIPGADDGGSGVAVLLEIARQLQSNPVNIGVDFLLFDAEDQGKDDDSNPQPESWCLGSQYWSRNIVPPGYRPKYGILLDMVGASDAKFPKEGVSMNYAPTLVNKVWKLAKDLGYGNYFVETKTGPITDDHYFVNTLAKISMINIINTNSETGTGFGAHWHTHKDNLDVINPRTLKAVGQTLLEVIYREAANKF